MTRRRVLQAGGVILAIGFLSISTEALVRARIPDPRRRIPSELYTRPVPWGAGREPRPPVAIGAVDGLAEDRVPVRLGDVPASLVQAILAVEDQRFYQHRGIDFRRIFGALIADVRAGAPAQGGSTLTQQLAKNLFLNSSRSPVRKLREAAMASMLELRYSKTAILESYLNEIYLGQDGPRAIHGVGAAARFYFGKNVQRLTLAESALLAATINAPNHNAPNRHPDVARDRRDLVLQLMADQHRISAAAAAEASRVPLPMRVHPATMLDGRSFRDVELAALGHSVPARGVAVYTTLDASLQRAAEHAVDRGLARLDAGVQAALVALDPRTGEVLAMVGGRDYGASQFNRATSAIRQPGSAFKPIVALTALAPSGSHPPTFTLASVVNDEPLSVETASGPWEPTDYDGEFRGPVSVREAMEQSLNVPFARIGLAIGPKSIVETARRLGITNALDPVPSIALGSSGVTLLELVRAYGVLAAAGELAPTRTLLGQARYGETVRAVPAPAATPVIDPAVAYLVTSSLEGVISRGTGRALSTAGHVGAIAGKTGTSSNWRDAWFVAYSTSLVVGVWVGYDDGRSLHLTGASAALPIVAQFLAETTTDDDWTPFEMPHGVTEANVGADGDPECGTREVFLAGTEPPSADCETPEIPGVIRLRDWSESLGNRARQLLQRFISRELETIRRGR
ncbi:MAG: transglycosylase domain-containing protein [Gemmatimonadales bacterium]